MKKKLLFVITKSNWGGAGRYVYDLATSLNETYDVSVALGGQGALFVKLTENGIRTIPLPSLERDIGVLHDTAAFFELLTVFKNERPDIVHLNSSKAGGLGALAARIARVPRIVFTAHGWAYNEPVPFPAKLFRWATSLATGVLAHRVIAVSEFDALHSPLGITALPIHNGIEPPDFLDRSAARRAIGIADTAALTVIGTIAELHQNKGIDILINAVPRVTNAMFVIIGEGEEREKLEAQITHAQLEERVELLGFIPNAATYLKAFDVFVLPSRKEGLPYVLLEAGFAQVAAVASTVGGIPEIIDDGLSGALFPAHDSAALARALNELSAAPSTRTHYAERLKEKVSRYFNLRGMVKRTIEVYETN